MKIDPIPPLNSLVAFEASARHLSFTLAAQELNVTQGAISRQVRLLEDYLGTTLFERNTRTINLSATGSQYFETVHELLTRLSRATGKIRHWQGAQQVTVLTSTALASLWLLPKVAEFQRDNEEIDLRIIAHDHVKDFSRVDCDLALFYCSTPPKDIRKKFSPFAALATLQSILTFDRQLTCMPAPGSGWKIRSATGSAGANGSNALAIQAWNPGIALTSTAILC